MNIFVCVCLFVRFKSHDNGKLFCLYMNGADGANVSYLKFKIFGMRLYFRYCNIIVSHFYARISETREKKKERNKNTKHIVDIDRLENGNISGFLVFKFNGILFGIRRSLM